MYTRPLVIPEECIQTVEDAIGDTIKLPAELYPGFRSFADWLYLDKITPDLLGSYKEDGLLRAYAPGELLRAPQFQNIVMDQILLMFSCNPQSPIGFVCSPSWRELRPDSKTQQITYPYLRSVEGRLLRGDTAASGKGKTGRYLLPVAETLHKHKWVQYFWLGKLVERFLLLRVSPAW